MIDNLNRVSVGGMEQHLIDAATANFLVKVTWYAVTALVTGGVAVIGTLLWGKGGRKRLVEDNKNLNRRIATLEARASMPAISQTFNFNTGTGADDQDRQLRKAIEAKTVHGLKETIKRLPQMPLGDGHSYARLPDGTNIVTMADGTMRLALPVRLSVSFQGGLDGSLSATVEHGSNTSLAEARANWLASPGAGLLAAKLIMAAQTMKDAREIYAAFRAAPNRNDVAAANWAFADWLHDAGCGDELYDFGYDRTNEGEELVVDENMQVDLRRWKES